MEIKHTPGPWHRNIKPARKYPIIFSGRNRHVAQILTDGLTDEEIEANCDLITSAPAMAERIRDLELEVEKFVGRMLAREEIIAEKNKEIELLKKKES
jgi:hypothetical protein